MYYRALACDYDGTLATHGLVDEATVGSLRRLIASGRQLLMVTGRELSELLALFPQLDIFDYVVAENGALLYDPTTKEKCPIAPPPPLEFVEELVRRGVGPISVGSVVVATWEPHQETILSVIHDMQLDLQMIFNKGAIMILPSGTNKATGLAAALKELQLSRRNVIGIGDAENDQAFLRYCQLGAATSNALQSLKDQAELVTSADHGRGVEELIEHILKNDAADIIDRRNHLALKAHDDAEPTHWSPGRQHLLLQAESGSVNELGNLAQQLRHEDYQYCWFTLADHHPQDTSAKRRVGDPRLHGTGSSVVELGSSEHSPHSEDLLKNLASPEQCVHAVIGAGSLETRRESLLSLCTELHHFMSTHGRPHVVILPTAAELRRLGFSADFFRGLFPSIVLASDSSKELQRSLAGAASVITYPTEPSPTASP